jgi:hypothetical protein
VPRCCRRWINDGCRSNIVNIVQQFNSNHGLSLLQQKVWNSGGRGVWGGSHISID